MSLNDVNIIDTIDLTESMIGIVIKVLTEIPRDCGLPWTQKLAGLFSLIPI